MIKQSGFAAVVALALAVSGCVTSEQVSKAVTSSTPATLKERRIIIDYIRNTLKDPYSIRDAEISYFFVNSRGNRAGCLSFNAKNSYGAYIGKTLNSVVISDDQVIYAVQSDGGCHALQNQGVRWEKFPELEAI